MADYKFEPGHTGARRVGDYVIHGRLGEGGMARVYAADERRPVALKRLRAEFNASEHGRQQFVTEMSISPSSTTRESSAVSRAPRSTQQLVMVLDRRDR